jgi:hypothetical protein
MKFGKRLVFLLLSFTMISAAQGDDSQFHFKELSKLIQSRHLTTIEQVIPNLPSELRHNFVLMYHSNSRHRGASFSQPRIIMFNASADMIIAAAGDADQENGNSLEVIENVGPKSQFTFHQIVFSKDGSAPVSGSNSSCMACHRANPSPNWDAYPSWPGVYGSQALQDSAERSGFKSFIEKVKSKDPLVSRYQSLSIDDNTTLEYLASTNHTLANLTGYLNKQRIISAFQDALKKNPKFKKLKISMAMLSSGCTEDASSIVPEEFRSKLTESFKDYQDRSIKTTFDHALNDSKVSYELAEGHSVPQEINWAVGTQTAFFDEVKPFVGIGYLMKYVMGIDPESFALSVEASVDHPPGAVPSASVYNSNDSLVSIQSDLLGDDLSFLSCDDLKSRLPQ